MLLRHFCFLHLELKAVVSDYPILVHVLENSFLASLPHLYSGHHVVGTHWRDIDGTHSGFQELFPGQVTLVNSLTVSPDLGNIETRIEVSLRGGTASLLLER